MDMHFEGVVFQTHAAELAHRLAAARPPCALLDVRAAARYAEGHIPGARSVTLEELGRGLPAGTVAATEFVVAGADPRDATVRAATLALRRAGARRIVEFPGGVLEWADGGRPLESGPAVPQKPVP